MILEDKAVTQSLKKIIQEEGCRAEWAISQVHEKYVKIFDSLEEDYFKQRQSDVSDVLSKVYLNLKATEKVEKDDHKEKILVAHDLLPSEAATSLSEGNVLAVALEMGGPTSHTAILARSLNIPACDGCAEYHEEGESRGLFDCRWNGWRGHYQSTLSYQERIHQQKR